MSPKGGNPDTVVHLVEKLKTNLNDILDDNEGFQEDLYLLQWLKRHNFEVEKTETYIRESIKWRKENDIAKLARADIYSEFPGLSLEYSFDLECTGKDGQPVIIVNINGLNGEAQVRKYGREMILRYLFCMFSKVELMLFKQIQELKRKTTENLKSSESLRIDSNSNVNWDKSEPDLREMLDVKLGFVTIVSAKDISIWSCTSKETFSIFYEVARVGANYFPVGTSEAYLINLNTFGTVMFKLVKPIISSSAYEIYCFNSDVSKWLPVLKKIIGEKNFKQEFERMNISLK